MNNNNNFNVPINNPQFNSMVSAYEQYRADPMQAVRATYNIPEDIDTSNPDNIIQHLYNTGQVTPQQMNRINSLRNNPLIMKLMGMRF